MHEATAAGSFGDLLRRFRAVAELTQEALAERSGLSRRGIADLERGARRAPYRHTVERLAIALGLSQVDQALLIAAGQSPSKAKRRDAPPNRGGTEPVQTTKFFGRQSEVAQISAMLDTARLVTLTGPGGVGKTRLALRVANEVRTKFADGVWFIDFAPVSEKAVLHEVLAAAIGVREEPSRSLLVTVSEWIRERHLCLALDNCEHVIGGCAALATDLLRSAPNLHILATSREAFNVGGERVWSVAPLAAPDPADLPPLRRIQAYPAVQLLLERAHAVDPSLTLDEHTAKAVAQVCWRLDGIPLAIELAAARLALLNIEQLAERLDDRFRLLSSASLTALPRHRTLRGTIDWSYDLLTESEQGVLRSLAAFAGGWSLEAAEAVCADGVSIQSFDVVDLLSRLIDKSLVVREHHDGESRFRLLDTIHQYAVVKLDQTGESVAVRSRHLEWCLALATQAEPHLGGTEKTLWMARLEREQDNIRAALHWALDQSLCDRAFQLGGCSWRFWWTRAHFREGQRLLEELLSRAGSVPAHLRAPVLEGAGWMANHLGEPDRAEQRFTEALELRRAAGEPRALADTLGWLAAVAADLGDVSRAIQLAEEGTDVAARQSDPRTLSQALMRLGTHLTDAGDAERSVALMERGLALARAAGDMYSVAAGLATLGLAERLRGNLTRAAAVLEEDLELIDKLGCHLTAAEARYQLADVLWRLGQSDEAHSLCNSGLRIADAGGNTRRVANALRVVASLAAAKGQYVRAGLVCGAAEALLAQANLRFMPIERSDLNAALEAVEDGLGAATLAAIRARGRQLHLDEAIAVAIADDDAVAVTVIGLVSTAGSNGESPIEPSRPISFQAEFEAAG